MEKKKIMMVDDEEDFLTIIKLNLLATGLYDVATFSTTENIIENIDKYRPDIIILDILMPGISGIEACKMIRKDPIGKDIPVVMLSALDKESVQSNIDGLMVADYISKPIEVDELIVHLDKVLKK